MEKKPVSYHKWDEISNLVRVHMISHQTFFNKSSVGRDCFCDYIQDRQNWVSTDVSTMHVDLPQTLWYHIPIDFSYLLLVEYSDKPANSLLSSTEHSTLFPHCQSTTTTTHRLCTNNSKWRWIIQAKRQMHFTKRKSVLYRHERTNKRKRTIDIWRGERL